VREVDPRIRNLMVAGLVPLVLLFFVFHSTAGDNTRTVGGEPAPTVPAVEASASVQAGVEGSGAGRFYSHALDLLEVDGLSPDLDPGTPVEIWVTWGHGERVSKPQRWVTGAVFERIAPAVTPTGSDVVVLNIPADQRRKMIWAGYGAITLFAEDG
jgi:hypothetical protein